uniref:Uncharacterized protein n=1 Tax=Oryza meridionalis TaxID=40149 RepID=A0A0E0EJF9_9ORYZ
MDMLLFENLLKPTATLDLASPSLSSRPLSPMAALPDVRRQAASCGCAISAPGGPASIGRGLRGIGDGGGLAARSFNSGQIHPAISFTTGKIRGVAIEEKAYHQQSAINHADIMHANDYQKLRLEDAEASQAA